MGSMDWVVVAGLKGKKEVGGGGDWGENIKE